MSIEIHTYSNPYRLTGESYWDDIEHALQLCASQTLANGLIDRYREFNTIQLTTIVNFIDSLFENWDSDAAFIKQMADIDNLIHQTDLHDIYSENYEQAEQSILRNRQELVDSLRVLFELNLDPDHINTDSLTKDQLALVRFYQKMYFKDSSSFSGIKKKISEEDVEETINYTIENRCKYIEQFGSETERTKMSVWKQAIDHSTIVINGIHQFSPVMLRTIEILGKYKRVILLFNYVPDCASVYKTWLNVYNQFEQKTEKSQKDYAIISDRAQHTVLARSMNDLASGNTSAVDPNVHIEVTEFDNAIEFANYIAAIFQKALDTQKKVVEDTQGDVNHPALFYMHEQIYSANSEVNNVLKLYFPDQFKERNFLDYPIGHFFLSIMKMWNPENGQMQIDDPNDIFECLSCGIIAEDYHGQLASLFRRVSLYLSGKTIEEYINELEDLSDLIDEFEYEEEEDETVLRKTEYLFMNSEEIDTLINGLSDLNDIAENFYRDFDEDSSSFSQFYQKVYDVLQTHVLEADHVDEEFRSIVVRVLKRLDDVKDIQANASFSCLKDTIEIYLQQIPEERTGAHWIARNFEQIDGDVLRRGNAKNTLHFACLSDQDMNAAAREVFPWPLDVNFFDTVQDPVDWKYRVYRTSMIEKKNFKCYAMVYGLLFTESPIKLSYVKHEGKNTVDLYYLLNLLNADIKVYHTEKKEYYPRSTDSIQLVQNRMGSYKVGDFWNYHVCPYRFLLSSVIDGTPIYRDTYQISRDLEFSLQNKIWTAKQGKLYSENFIESELNEWSESEIGIDAYPFLNRTDVMEIVTAIKNNLYKYACKNGKFRNMDKEKELTQQIMAWFLNSLSKEKRNELQQLNYREIDSQLGEAQLKDEKYYGRHGSYCRTCPVRDACLEGYKFGIKETDSDDQ